MTRRRLNVAIGVLSGLLALAVAVAATQISSLQGAVPTTQAPRGPAPEFTGITRWFNSPPLTMASLRGEVVWVDVWTYSCINCLRTLPDVRAMHERYGAHGLRVIGLHSPEFTFEKDPDNVAAAIAREQITYPVALDAEMATWRAWRNHYWPRVYLVDARGRVRYDHIGEGGSDELQEQVRALLREAGKTLPPPVDLGRDGPAGGITPETYAGYRRGSGSLANPEGFAQGAVTRHRAVADVRALGTGGRIALTGPWRAEAEFIEAAGPGARLELPFLARDVYVVAASARGPLSVRLLLDGAPVPAASRGADLRGSVLPVDRSDLYRVLALERPSEHVLTLEAEQGTRIYAFTFG